MASGSNNLTSYKAKQIIGSSIAASPSGALLLTGEHYTGNTWLYHYGYGGTTNPWGIFHDTTAEKLIIKGSGTDSFWIKMNTGDTYVLGKMGIGYDPNTTGNNYKLYVNGSAYFDIGTDSTSDLDFVINGSNAYLSFSGQGIKSFTSADVNNTLFLNYNGGQTQIGGSGYLVGSVGIGYDPDTNGNTYKLYVNGSTNITGTTTFGDYLYRAYTASDQTPMIWMNSSNFDNYLWQIGSGTANGKQYYGYGLKYTGTGSGVANYLQLIADNQNGTDVVAIGINQSGQVGIGANANTNYRLYVNGTSYFTDNMTFVSTGGSGTTGTSPSISWSGSTDSASIYYTVPSADAGILVINMTDDANARISLRTQGTERIGIDSNGTYVNTQLQRAGKSVSWYQGRNTAIIKTTSYSGYDAILSMKTTNGDWSQGVYSSNIMYWTYITDTNYNANTNTITSQMYLTSEGHLHLSYGNLYIHKANSGIYYQGTNSTFRMIRFIEGDANGQGISIGGGGLTILGSGESADTIVSNVTSAGATETTYIASDNNIIFYPGQQSYDASATITISPSRIWAGVNGNTTREAQVGCQSGAGQIYLLSAASTSGIRGLYAPAHGSGGALGIIEVNTNNNTVIRGHDTWGNKVRIVDNWVGFYSATHNTGTRYGHIQANADRMYFRKENGISTYGFDFNSHLYSTGGYYSTTSCGLSITPAGSPWPYINFGTNAGGSTYVSVAQTTWCQLYTQVPTKRASDNYYYKSRFFFREYSKTANTTTRLNYYEDFYLPEATDGRTANAGYSILTTKDMSFNITGRANSVKDRTNDNTTYLNYGAAGLAASAITWLCCWNGYEVRAISKGEMANATDSAHKWVRIGGDTMTSTLTLTGGSVDVQKGNIYAGVQGDTAAERQILVRAGAGGLYMYAQPSTSGNRGLYGWNGSNTWCSVFSINSSNYIYAGSRLYGAVWNDYAEFRLGQMDNLKPGQIVTENGDGTMRLATKRLQKGCKVLSDTYGFALGETKDCKLPIAVSGRVLVYCDTPFDELEPGDCVCSNTTGNVVKMTRAEIINYPDCIIGTVSEIPTYDIWHGGDQNDPKGMKEEVEVKGRIWIYVR